MARTDDTMLMAYVDGEIDDATAREIETAIAADPALAARARTLRDSSALARAAFADALHEPVPDRLLAALSAPAAGKIVRLAAPRQGGGVRMAMYGWALAASLAALVVGYSAGTMNFRDIASPAGIQNASSDRWLDHVAGFYQVYANSLATKDRLLVDVNAEDVPELEKWFGAKLNRRLVVPNLSARGFSAQGGRLLIIGGKPAAQFLYYSGAGELIGLVIAFSEAPYLPGQTDRRGDVNIVHWRSDGYAYALAGTIEQQRLQEIADSIWRDLARAS